MNHPLFFQPKSVMPVFAPNLVKLVRDQRVQAPANQQISSSEFLCAISHELKTPLNAIIAFAELLEEGDVSAEEFADYVKEILQAAQEMSELVNDLLDVGAVNSGNFSVDLSNKINVAELINRVVKLNYGYALKRNISLKSEISAAVTAINLDEKRLKQIVTNLVSNAVKYSSKGGEVKISAEKIDDAFLQIAISDQGFGMTAEQVDLAFNKYQTIKNPNSGSVDSFGLGLPIVKQLTESMNGIIEVQSEVNKGTEVILKFPYLM